MTALVLLDLDGTLVPGPSAERRFLRWLLSHGLVGFSGLGRSAWFAVRFFPAFGREVWKKNKAYLAGLPVAQMGRWGSEFVEAELLPLVRPELVARLRAHLAAGDEIVLLTGAPDFLAQPLAERLHVQHVRATRCATRGGRFADAPPLVHPFGEQKLALAQALCQALGCDWSRVTAYADSFADLPLLERVGEAVVVCPDARLALIAQRKGWEVLSVPARGARDARFGSVQPGVHSRAGASVARVAPTDRKL